MRTRIALIQIVCNVLFFGSLLGASAYQNWSNHHLHHWITLTVDAIAVYTWLACATLFVLVFWGSIIGMIAMILAGGLYQQRLALKVVDDAERKCYISHSAIHAVEQEAPNDERAE